MFIDKPAPFINAFVEELDESLRKIEPKAGLTNLQKKWIAFCLLAIVVTNSVCWARFERASLGNYSTAALCCALAAKRASATRSGSVGSFVWEMESATTPLLMIVVFIFTPLAVTISVWM